VRPAARAARRPPADGSVERIVTGPAQVRQARAAYDGTVANYRQTVLTAFRQAEDQLSTLRILEQQVDVQEHTVKSADLAVQLTLN
jgi:outer membrane protein TolC